MIDTPIREAPQPQQVRSKAAVRRMLEAGRELLNHRDIDDVSVQDVVRRARSSIGSFYHHFGTKEAFFQALIAEMAVNREAIAMSVYAGAPMDDLPAMLVKGALDNHRRYRGMMRSAIRQHLGGSPVWAPISVMGQKIADEYVRRLELDLGRALRPREKERVAFAFVWLYGALAQSVLDLNTLSAYKIPDEIFEEEMISSFSSLLGRAIVPSSDAQ